MLKQVTLSGCVMICMSMFSASWLIPADRVTCNWDRE